MHSLFVSCQCRWSWRRYDYGINIESCVKIWSFGYAATTGTNQGWHSLFPGALPERTVSPLYTHYFILILYPMTSTDVKMIEIRVQQAVALNVFMTTAAHFSSSTVPLPFSTMDTLSVTFAALNFPIPYGSQARVPVLSSCIAGTFLMSIDIFRHWLDRTTTWRQLTYWSSTKKLQSLMTSRAEKNTQDLIIDTWRKPLSWWRRIGAYSSRIWSYHAVSVLKQMATVDAHWKFVSPPCRLTPVVETWNHSSCEGVS